jgi:hypothetical protein
VFESWFIRDDFVEKISKMERGPDGPRRKLKTDVY